MAKSFNKAYFIGIAGNTMAPLAKAFKDMGWEVRGSDQEKVYPPITDYLSHHKIKYFKGYKEKNLPPDSDLVVVGRSPLLISKTNPEYLKAVSLKLNVLSYPEVINKYLIKKNSVVVAGTYGKSTTAALAVWILMNAGLNPSFMIGGVPLNFQDGLKITDSEYSVVEGDETPSLRETDPPKFMFYRPKFLLLTATEYDHPEIYKSKNNYLDAYIGLVKLLGDDGVLIYDQDSVDKRVIAACRCKKVPYSTLVKTFNNKVVYKESALRAAVLGKELKIDQQIIAGSISSFMGLKDRNESLGIYGGRLLYRDLSQQPSKVKFALSVLRQMYPQKKIIVVFNPSATALKFIQILSGFEDAFLSADQVIIGKVSFLSTIGKNDRITGKDLVTVISKTQDNVFYEPIDGKIIDWLLKNSQKNNVIIFISSGGLAFTNLIKKTIYKLSSL